MPKISVVIPVYNAEKFLEKCLDSVLGQTLSDLEIICINDGSKDNSAKILKSYAAADKRIQIITKKNAGVSAARNDGIGAATGDFIHFLDADDYIDADYYERMFSAAKNSTSDIACSGFVTDSKHTHGLQYKKYRLLTGIKQKLRGTNALLDGYVWRYLFNRKFLIKNKLKFDTTLISQEDVVFVLDAIARTDSVVIVPDTNYHYILNTASALNNRDPAHHAKMKAHYKRGKEYRKQFAAKHNVMWIWKIRKLQKIPFIGKYL